MAKLTKRVNLRGVPKELAGVPVSRETLERIKIRVGEVMPIRPMERPLSDLLAAAYMAGIVDGLTKVAPMQAKQEAGRAALSDKGEA